MPNNMNNIMKQAQKMQKQMAEMQAEMETKIFEATSGGGAVKVELNGKKELTKVTIQKEAVDPDDVEMLEDLIVAAVNEGLKKVDEKANSQMSKISGGLDMFSGL
jgi:DNA-binding YbaB/EbfC family protein